jgi:DNA-binding MarR family transcriptional regulator
MQYNKETSVGFALTTTLNLLRKNFNKQIKEFDLSSEQYGVLKLVKESDKLTPTQLAELLNRDKATITRIIKSLFNKNLIKKQNINNRSFYIILTQNGNEMLQKADKIAMQYHKIMMDKIGEKEIIQMLDTLKKIREII